jgi:hypothetical protein
MIDDVLGVRGVLRSVLHAIYGRSSLHLHTGVVRYVRGEGHLRAPGLRGGIGVRPRSRPLSLDRRRTVACRFPEHGSRHAGPPRDSPSASTRLWGETMPTPRDSCLRKPAGPSGSSRPRRRPGWTTRRRRSEPSVGSLSNMPRASARTGQTLAQRLLGAVEPPYIEMASFFDVAGGAVTFVVAPLASRCRLTQR